MPEAATFEHYNRIAAFVDDYRATLPQAIAVDTETSGVWWQDTAFCMTVAWEGSSHFIDLDVLETSARKGEVLAILKNVKGLIFHNAKFDVQKLAAAGIIDKRDLTPKRLHDTQTQAHLLNEHRSKRLKDLAKEELGLETTEDERLRELKTELKLTKEHGYDRIYNADHPTAKQELIEYALKDAEFTYALWVKFTKQMARFPLLVGKYDKERALLLVIIEIEAHGLAIDMERTEQLIKEYGTKILKARKTIAEYSGRRIFEEADLIPQKLPEPVWNKAGTKILRTHETQNAAKERAARETFNPNSPPQVIDVFEDLGIYVTAANKEHLEGVDHPLAGAILALRSLEKIRGTYLMGIRQEAVLEDGQYILHPNFRTTGTKTGRFSSGKHEE